MKVATTRFGEMEVADDKILHFPDGIPGFPDDRRLALVEVAESEGVFYWLQSLDDPELAFLSAVPWPFFPDYELELPDADQDVLGLTDADDAMVLCILTVDREAEKLTANLLAPVVVNQQTRRGRQVILDDPELPLRAEFPD